MTNLLQRLTLPAPGFSEPLLYLRTTGDVRIVPGGLVIGDGSTVTFDTSFGVFHAGRWRRLTSVNSLFVNVRASGTVPVRRLSPVGRCHGGRARPTM